MLAILIKDGKGPVENLYVGETTTPVPDAGQVLVKIKAFGLNRMDLSQREGRYPMPKNASSILGVEFSGTVADVGPEPEAGSIQAEAIKRWSEGDEVYGLATGGAYAEYIVVNATHLIAKPKHLSWVEAASIPEAFLTAFQALFLLADLKPSEDVLVHAGASGVGLAAIQLARFVGAKTVTSTSSTKEKLDFITSIHNGATIGVNYKTEDFAAEVKKVTGGKGVDVVIDFVGQSHWDKNIDSLGLDGRMVMLALLSGSSIPDCDLVPLMRKRLHIIGTTLRVRPTEYQAGLISRFTKEAAGSITGKDGNGELRTYIDKVYPWDRIQDAHRDIAANTNIGKIVMEVV